MGRRIPPPDSGPIEPVDLPHALAMPQVRERLFNLLARQLRAALSA
ncbi:MAG: hypothetical protein ACREDO_05745 [Methyloceanibacter sp.]